MASPAQRKSQVAPLQLTEHEPVQVMWQVELPLHETLPLAPSVVVQTELSVQLRLHESRQEPAQLVWFAQESEQLPASPPQVPALKAQLIPELHEQVATGAGRRRCGCRARPSAGAKTKEENEGCE